MPHRHQHGEPDRLTSGQMVIAVLIAVPIFIFIGGICMMFLFSGTFIP